MRKLMFTVVMVVFVAIPATATADKLPDVVSIHADQAFCCTNEIFGSVESPAAKCERNRTIILFYYGSNGGKRGPGFQPVASTTTDSKGEYLFDGNNVVTKRGFTFPPGKYFSRVTRAQRGGDVCRRDDSRVLQISDFN